MVAPMDLCSSQRDAESCICQEYRSYKDGIKLKSIPPLRPHRGTKRHSEYLRILQHRAYTMNLYRLSARLGAADGKLGFEADFQQELLRIYGGDTFPDKFSLDGAKITDPSLFTSRENPNNYPRHSSDDDVESTSSDEIGTCILSTPPHRVVSGEKKTLCKQREQVLRLQPFNEELVMIDKMMTENTASTNLPLSAIDAGWTSIAEPKVGVDHYAILQVPHRNFNSPPVRFKIEQAEDRNELDYFLSQFDYSQFYPPPPRPSFVEHTSTRKAYNIVTPPAQHCVDSVRSQAKQSVSGLRFKSIPSPPINNNEKVLATSVRCTAQLAATSPQPEQDSINVQKEKVDQELIGKSNKSKVFSQLGKGLPEIPLPIQNAGHTHMPGSWLSTSSAATTLETVESLKDGKEKTNIQKIKSPLTSTISSIIKSPLRSKKSQPVSLYAVSDKYGLKREKDYSSIKSTLATKALVMTTPFEEPFKSIKTSAGSADAEEKEANSLNQPRIPVYPRNVVRKPSQRR